jgi:hypothetical protein
MRSLDTKAVQYCTRHPAAYFRFRYRTKGVGDHQAGAKGFAKLLRFFIAQVHR